jgi:hypothetical protein
MTEPIQHTRRTSVLSMVVATRTHAEWAEWAREKESEVKRLRRANERLETSLCHVINRLSTEGRDDAQGHIFLADELKKR